jgi:hypothetical protein
MIAEDALAFLLLTLVGVGGALPTNGIYLSHVS